MMTKVLMPRLGETMEEGTIIKWFKKTGDFIMRGENLLEVETDKVNIEIPSFVSGILKEVLVEEGKMVPIGEVIATIEESDNKG